MVLHFISFIFMYFKKLNEIVVREYDELSIWICSVSASIPTHTSSISNDRKTKRMNNVELSDGDGNGEDAGNQFLSIQLFVFGFSVHLLLHVLIPCNIFISSSLVIWEYNIEHHRLMDVVEFELAWMGWRNVRIRIRYPLLLQFDMVFIIELQFIILSSKIHSKK